MISNLFQIDLNLIELTVLDPHICCTLDQLTTYLLAMINFSCGPNQFTAMCAIEMLYFCLIQYLVCLFSYALNC